MDFNGILALMNVIIIVALTIGMVFRQLTKWKRRDSESTSRMDDASGEQNEACSESTLSADNASGEKNEAYSESTLSADSASGEENKACADSASEEENVACADAASGEENEACSESTMSAENASGEEYDVFLSFRGSDTRLNFTDYLYHSMVRAGIRVFLDSEELEVGKEIREVLNALNKSRIYMPIFSQNFASSIWCLREVARMVECQEKSDEKKEIIPIFYYVKTDDVKLRTNLYKEAIIKHKEKSKPGEMKRWQDALKTVGKIIGLEAQGKRHGENIELIVEKVCRKLNTRRMIVTKHLVEDNAQVQAIMKLLDVGSGGVRFVGIHGMGGVGKTTLAKVIFNKLSFHFECCTFLEDVRASSQPRDGLLGLQKKLLSDLANHGIANQIEDFDGGIKMIKKALSNKKVLIVLDDLNEKEQLTKLAGKSDWFCLGSRIIITTRDKSILMTQVSSSSKEVLNQPEAILHYEVREMRFDLALHLFYKHAFRSDFAVEEYDALSREIVRAVGMLPLPIVVIGSNLFDWGRDLGRLDKREVWDETLEKLKEGPFEDVRYTLMISYEQLKDTEKEIFLDIACFFTNDDITYPFIMWKDCEYSPNIATRVLCQRSLIKIRDDNTFWMHDQIRDFGRYIVLQVYPRKFCRVWIREDALKLLEAKKRSEDVEALSLMFDGHSFTREELACLPKLRFLRVREFDFSGNFENFHSELRWLSCQTWQTTFHAENFHFNELVVLDLSNSNIEDGWVGWSQMKMNKLKVLDLTSCVQLKRTPDFSNFVSLEKLILARCVKLTTIDSSIGKLKLLKTLNIQGCRSLGELPAEVGSLQALTEITMPRNFQRFNLPETFGNLKSLLSFVLDEHPGITRLPSSIGGLVTLERLSLRGCVGIKELPPSIGDLKMLAELDLSRSGVVELPDSIGNLKKLKVIRVSYTMIRKFPHTIGHVEMLEELHAKKCWNLTDENLEEIRKLSHLRILDLSYTHISRFPMVICCLSRLQTLQMSLSHLEAVPDLPSSLTHLHVQAHHFPSIPDLSSLVNLDYLELSRLTSPIEESDPSWTNNLLEKQTIHPFPSSLSALKLRGISLLPPFSNLKNLSVLCVIRFPMLRFFVPQDLIHLRELKVSKCELLMEICGLSLLKNLQRLDLNRLGNLVEINGLSELVSLMYLRISHCDRIERLPNLSKLDKLQHIELEGCQNIRAIEGIEGLESMELDNCGCIVLERLLDVSRSTWLSRRAPECQVFLSFSRPGTPYSIVDVLYANLVRNQISVIKDDDDLSSDDEIGEELPPALKNSRIYVVFLSKNYVSSWRCLRELAHMVKCTSNSYGEKRILPIFYDVEVDDVKLESDLYKRALDEHRREFGNEVEEWETALREVAGMQGFDLKTKSPGELIDLVVEEVLHKLDAKSVDMPEYLVEDHQIKDKTEKWDVKSTNEEDQNQPEGTSAYEVHEMEYGRALELFCKCAFRRDSPLEGYDHLAEKVVRRVSMHPLAVEVIGSYLYCQGVDLEQHFDKNKLWEDTLKQLEEGPFKDVRDALMISYEGMENTQKEVFLDIACFFTNKDKTYPVIMWGDCNYHPPSAIDVLLSRSLIQIRDNKFWMHDQVQNLGRHIVLEEYPCKFSRVWTHEDALKLLKRKEGTSKMEALCLDEYSCGSYTSEQFKDLTNLRFLQVNGVNFTGDFQNLLPQLRWLQWERCPSDFVAANFHLKKLVVLTLSCSEISESWGGWGLLKMATELKVLNLASCHRLTETPDLSGLESLEVLILEDCKNLEKIHPSIKDIKTLVSLNVSRCRRLKELPAGVGRMEELRDLLLDNTAIQEIPVSRGCLMKLKTLSARGFSRLAQLPESMGSLVSLTKLDLSFTRIKELPEFVGSWKKLDTLDASNSAFLAHIPNSISHLASLSLLNLSYCTKLAQLPDSIGSLSCLQRLLLQGCLSLRKIPDSIGNLSSLTELDVKSTIVAELPESIGKLQNLKILDIRDTDIIELPGAVEMLAKLQLCVKKSHPETMPLKMQREASAPGIVLPRESKEKMTDDARQRAADMETSDKNHAIAAVQNVVGIDDCVKQITDLLEMEVNDEVRIIGIYGTDGIGKTTLAKSVYDRISSCFDSCSFLAEVEETTQNPRGIQFLQTKLIRDILERDCGGPSFDERIEHFLGIFRDMKVLIVVDDVEKQSHLHAIVGDRLHWFGPGSRIIVTSQNKEILKEYDPEKARTYMVDKLDDGQALELFRMHAFGTQYCKSGYDEIANGLVNATVKLPLAVEVVGSFLRGKSIQEWEKMEESMNECMTSSQKTTVGLEEILDICYKALDRQQKEIFLDIACFISGVDARIASYMWPIPSSDCILMPLAKIGENNELQMHRLLRCRGKRIFKQEESQDPSSRRFCTQDMVLKALNREKGIEDVESHDSCILTAVNLASMPAIKFLKLDDAEVSGDFAGAFPSLRWFCWQRVPLEFGAINFVLTELIIFDLSGSKVTEDWGGWSEFKMVNLKVLNLTGCSDLLITPDFSGYEKLEILILERCSGLVKLHPSIGHLKRLVSLNLKSCSQLSWLPVEVGGMTALKELFIDGTSVREIPISIGNLKQLKILSGFKCFPLTCLPSSISYLTALSELSLDGAKISELPSSLGELLNLRRLSLRDCRNMEELPDSIGKLGSLEELDISATSVSELPDSIKNLESLRVLRMDSSFIRAVPGEIGNLTKLEELHASWCRSLKGPIPSDIKGLLHLRSLTLGHSSITSLPHEICAISGLHTLDFLQCNEIEELPKLPPSLICLRVSSKRMKRIPLLEDLKELEELCLGDGHPKARRPPTKQPMPESDVEQMIDRQSFSISFPKLRKLELSFSQVVNLQFVYEPTDILELKTLRLSGMSLEEIEGLEGLTALKRLDMSNCKIKYLNGIGQLTSLRSLILSDCEDLNSLPDLSNLKSLKVLEIRRCQTIHQIEGLEKLTSLEKLNISECPAEKLVQVQNALEHVKARSVKGRQGSSPLKGLMEKQG